MNSEEIKTKVMDSFNNGHQLTATDKGQGSGGPKFLSPATLAAMLCKGEFDDCEEVDFDAALYAKTIGSLLTDCTFISTSVELVQCEVCFDTEPDSYTIIFWLEG